MVGELGWTLDQYYLNSPYELLCASEGYFDKVDRTQEMFREISYNIYCACSKPGEAVPREQWWPMFKDRAAAQKEVPSWEATSKEVRDELIKNWKVK